MSTLVAYFSYSGTTRKAAEELSLHLGADLFEIRPAVPYLPQDVDWQDDNSRNVLEYKDPDSRPEIAEDVDGLEQYDTVYIGYPIWWYTHPRIINTFLESGDFSGKQIVLFATSSVTGIEGSLSDLKETYPGLDLTGGRKIFSSRDIRALCE